jgi:hypothetical protein
MLVFESVEGGNGESTRGHGHLIIMRNFMDDDGLIDQIKKHPLTHISQFLKLNFAPSFWIDYDDDNSLDK